MLKGRLAKQISDAAWSTLVSQLTYKTAEAGSQLVTVNRFYPSSKTCSCCGVVKATSKCGDSEAGASRAAILDLSDRVFSCEECGTYLDRDVNAARNIVAEGLRLLGEGTPGPAPPMLATTQ